MGSPWVPEIRMQSLSAGDVADLAGIDDEARRRVEVAEVLRDLGGVVDRAADEGDLAAVACGRAPWRCGCDGWRTRSS